MEIKKYVRKVNYYETDQMQVVHHSNYARFMEEARLDVMEQAGLSYDKMEELGVIVPVLTIDCAFKNAVHYGETIVVDARIVRVTPVRFDVNYVITEQSTGEVKTTGNSSHAFVDTNFRPMNLKKNYPDVFALMQELVEAGKDMQ